MSSHKQKVPCHRQYRTKILMANLVPGWSRAGPLLNLWKNFGGFNFFQNLWDLHIYRSEGKKENRRL